MTRGLIAGGLGRPARTEPVLMTKILLTLTPKQQNIEQITDSMTSANSIVCALGPIFQKLRLFSP